jgi:glutaredoxin
VLILYARPGCHLCEIAAERLARAGIAFEERSIAGNPDLEERYGIEIPVLTDDSGRVLLKGVFNDARIASLGLGSSKTHP